VWGLGDLDATRAYWRAITESCCLLLALSSEIKHCRVRETASTTDDNYVRLVVACRLSAGGIARADAPSGASLPEMWTG